MNLTNTSPATAISDEELTKSAVQSYWNKRSTAFAALRMQELQSNSAALWFKEIAAYLPAKKPLAILDVGTGSGFLALLLAAEGHQTTGIDLSPAMIAMAEKTSRHFRQMVHFSVMDAEQLNFPTASFDVVVSRNLTWTLPNPQQAYKEWLRVLKPGGVLLNFDADYGHVSFEEKSSLPAKHVHQDIAPTTLHECEQIKQSLPISRQRRPDWDISVLKELGAVQTMVDETISQRLYRQADQFYNPTPLFLLSAHKAQ